MQAEKENPTDDFVFPGHNLSKRLDIAVEDKDNVSSKDLVNAAKVAIRIQLGLTDATETDQKLKDLAKEITKSEEYWNKLAELRRYGRLSMDSSCSVYTRVSQIWETVFSDTNLHTPETDKEKWLSHLHQTLLEFFRWLVISSSTVEDLEKLKQADIDLAAMHDLTEKLQQNSEKLSGDNQKLANKIAELENDLKGKDDELKEQNDKLKKALDDGKDLGNEIKRIQGEATGKQKELDKLKPELDASNKDRKQLQGELEAEKAKSADKDKAINDLADQLAGLEDDLKKAEEEHKKLDKDKAALDKALKDKDKELDRAKADVKDLKKQLAFKSSPEPEKGDELAKLAKELEGKNAEIADLKDALADCKQKKAEDDAANEDKIQKLKDDLAEKLKKCNDEKKELEEELKNKDLEGKPGLAEGKPDNAPPPLPELGWELQYPVAIHGDKLRVLIQPVQAQGSADDWVPKQVFLHASGTAEKSIPVYVKKLETVYGKEPTPKKPLPKYLGNGKDIMSKPKGATLDLDKLPKDPIRGLTVDITNQDSPSDGTVVDKNKGIVQLLVSNKVPLNIPSSVNPEGAKNVSVLVTTDWENKTDGRRFVSQDLFPVDLKTAERVTEEEKCPPCGNKQQLPNPKTPTPPKEPAPQPQPEEVKPGDNNDADVDNDKGKEDEPLNPHVFKEVTTPDGHKLVKFGVKLPADKKLGAAIRVEIEGGNISQFSNLTNEEKKKVADVQEKPEFVPGVQPAQATISDYGTMIMKFDLKFASNLEPKDILNFELHPSYIEREQKGLMSYSVDELYKKNPLAKTYPKKRYILRENASSGVHITELYPVETAYFPISRRNADIARPLTVWNIRIFIPEVVKQEDPTTKKLTAGFMISKDAKPIFSELYAPSEKRLNDLVFSKPGQKGSWQFLNGRELTVQTSEGPRIDYVAVFAELPKSTSKPQTTATTKPASQIIGAPIIANLTKGIGNMFGFKQQVVSDSDSSEEEENEPTKETKAGLEDVY